MDRRTLAAAAAYLALAFVWAAPAALHPARSVPDLGDPLHLAWIMAWDAHQLVRHPLRLFEANGFYPYASSLTFADHLLPEALLVAPLNWATGNAVLAYNAAVLAALTLSALSAFLLVRRLTGRADAAFLAGLAYAFNALTLHELARVHVLNLQWWPLAWLFLDRFVREGRPRDAALAAAALALQGLSGTYYLAYTLLLLPLWLPAAFLAARRRPTRRVLLTLAGALAAAALPVGLMMLPYLRRLRGFGVEKGWAGGADLLTYVDPGARSWLWGRWHNPRLDPELPHFLGFAALVLVLLGLVHLLRGRLEDRARVGAVLAALTTLCGLLLSLGPIVNVGGRRVGPGVYDLLHRFFPPARAMASPERSGALVLLGASVLLGLGAAQVLARLPRRGAATAALGLAALLPLEHWTPPRPAALVPTGHAVPEAYRWLATQPAEPLVELPLYAERQKKWWSLYLYFSTLHWQRVPIGRASFYPPVHDALAWDLRGFPDDTALAALDRLNIHTVLVHPRLWPDGERAERVAALDAHPRLRLLRAFGESTAPAALGLGLGAERIYLLASGPPPRPLCAPADPVPPRGFTLDSTGINKPERAIDGDPRRAWSTAQPQRPGDRLDVALSAPEPLAAVAIRLHYPYEEFGRNLVLQVKTAEAGWRRVTYKDDPDVRWETLRALVATPLDARMVLRLETPETVTGVRLMVGAREEDPAWPRWSVPELELYRSCPNP